MKGKPLIRYCIWKDKTDTEENIKMEEQQDRRKARRKADNSKQERTESAK